MGTSVGVANWLFEKLAFIACRHLEAQGVVTRFCDTGRQLESHDTNNLWSVAVPYVLLYYTAFRALWPGLREGMCIDFNPLSTWGFICIAMIGHDAWFYSVHSLFHWNKALYRHVHQVHHTHGSNVTALGTAFGDAADIGLCFVAYHALVVLYLWASPRWNLVAFVLYIAVEVATNIAGHTGYQVPFWLHFLFTGGIGALPFAATTKTHYIHHLDPRFNKGLYFTFWDRLNGTYKDTHSLIDRSRVSCLKPSRIMADS